MAPEEYRAPPVGGIVTCSMWGVAENILNNEDDALRKILKRGLEELNFDIRTFPDADLFEPQGASVFAMLAESHVSVHTNPEYGGNLVIVMYSCRNEEDAIGFVRWFRREVHAMVSLVLTCPEVPIDLVMVMSDKRFKYDLEAHLPNAFDFAIAK
jgi:S-adenosylmethionine/arginine decarboxylase-like enzyme